MSTVELRSLLLFEDLGKLAIDFYIPFGVLKLLIGRIIRYFDFINLFNFSMLLVSCHFRTSLWNTSPYYI
ncbi:hypothetical protein IC582_005184 [Cucumis melo]